MTESRGRVKGHALAQQLTFFAVKLPPIILCEFFLARADHIYDAVNERLGTVFFQYIVFTISRLYLAVCLGGCFLLFSLKASHVLHVYECGLLVAQPFLFTYLMELVAASSSSLPRSLLALAVHAIIATNTIFLYRAIYHHVIRDKHAVYQTYLASRGDRVHSINDFLNSLGKEDLRRLSARTPRDSVATPMPHPPLLLSARSLYIVVYSLVSYGMNETSLFSSVTPLAPGEYFNIVSLGYLLLLTFDLSLNADQLAMRLLIKVRLLTLLFDEHGLNNMIGFNWFLKARLPYLLRCYFGFKWLAFTLKFVTYYGYYVALDEQMRHDTNTENFSLFAQVYSLFVEEPQQQQQQLRDMNGTAPIQVCLCCLNETILNIPSNNLTLIFI